MSSNAQLVLLTGSHAGLVAAILPGYYLVGRASHCQIRPKTRSVSRQHCLLYFGSGLPEPIATPASTEEAEETNRNTSIDAPRRIHVMDLGSASGTRVDGKRIPLRQWHEVSAGRELRCGKIAWRVMVNIPSQQIETPLPTDLPKVATLDNVSELPAGSDLETEESPPLDMPDDPSSSGDIDLPLDMVKGEAWQGDTVAAFLASHDEVDRKQRHEKIRATVKQKEAQSKEFGLAHEVQVEPVAADELETSVPESNRSDSETQSPKKHKADPARRDNAAGEKRKINLGGFFPSWETAKLALAIILAIAVIAFGIYQFNQFRSGPPVRVYEGIG